MHDKWVVWNYTKQQRKKREERDKFRPENKTKNMDEKDKIEEIPIINKNSNNTVGNNIEQNFSEKNGTVYTSFNGSSIIL